MTKDTMKNLNVEGLRATPTILKLADGSIVTPDGMIEDIVVTIDSLKYPTDFMILSPKVNLVCCPIILGCPWLAIADANISCRLGQGVRPYQMDRKQRNLSCILQYDPN